MNKKILIGCVIAVVLLIILNFPTVISESDDIINGKINIYRNARIQTKGRTNGMVFCFPGIVRSFVSSTIFPNRIFIFRPFVYYSYIFGWIGWNLHINSEYIPKGHGFIFGFSGKIWNGPRELMEFIEFNIDGIGRLIIHISE